jgi:hypothetical protein
VGIDVPSACGFEGLPPCLFSMTPQLPKTSIQRTQEAKPVSQDHPPGNQLRMAIRQDRQEILVRAHVTCFKSLTHDFVEVFPDLMDVIKRASAQSSPTDPAYRSHPAELGTGTPRKPVNLRAASIRKAVDQESLPRYPLPDHLPAKRLVAPIGKDAAIQPVDPIRPERIINGT